MFISIPWLVLLLQGIPEQIAVVNLAYTIAKITTKWGQTVLLGSILAIISFIIRSSSLPFGTHTIVLIIILFMCLTLKGFGDVSLSLIACLLSYTALFLFEFVALNGLMIIFDVTKETLFNNQLIMVAFGLPQVALLFILALLIKRKRRTP
jgi:hypothetical protein